jgi:Domain of unknown function (DUF4270)
VKNKITLLSFFSIVAVLLLTIASCKKINEATELGAGLIPPVDNINTFETYLDIETDNQLMNDTTKVFYNDYMALGNISSDPDFGATHADAYFNISRSSYFNNPFIHRDSLVGIDSVILSLSYEAAYGDTNSTQTFRVYEVAQNAGFNDTTFYKYNQADFLTTGGELGSKSFQISKLDDSILHIRKRDTTKLANVMRIPLLNSLGVRLSQYDTTNTANGGYRTDSIFKSLFRGLAVKADNGGNVLTYIDPASSEKTKLIVYYRLKVGGGVIDTTSTEFAHYTDGQANIIRRTPAGNWASYLSNGLPLDDRIFLQSAPGSFAQLRIPALDTFRNSVIHRAEIIVSPIASTQDNVFTYPQALFLDRINAANDTAYTFDTDMELAPGVGSFTYNFSLFGGLIKSDSTYRFNISRYVQNIVTTRSPNYKLRLYAPVRAFVYSPAAKVGGQIYLGDKPAFGRIAIAGGNYAAVPAKKMRMRVVYSKL